VPGCFELFMTKGYMSILNKLLLYVMSPKYNEIQSLLYNQGDTLHVMTNMNAHVTAHT